LTDPRIVQAFAERWRSPTPILGSRPNGIAWSPDGTQLTMAQADGSIRVWDTETGRSLYRLTGHDKSVVSVAFSGDGQRLASGSDDETVRVWGDLRGMFLFLNGPAPSPRAALISEALQHLWRLRPDGLDIESETWTWPRPAMAIMWIRNSVLTSGPPRPPPIPTASRSCVASICGPCWIRRQGRTSWTSCWIGSRSRNRGCSPEVLYTATRHNLSF